MHGGHQAIPNSFLIKRLATTKGSLGLDVEKCLLTTRRFHVHFEKNVWWPPGT
jgi:hypothetical protein